MNTERERLEAHLKEVSAKLNKRRWQILVCAHR